MPTIKWNDLPFKVYTKKQVIQKLEKVGQACTDHCKKKISGGRRWGGGEKSGKSGPGLPPHVDTGALRQSIFWNLTSETQVIFGTSKVYGLYLEFGAYIRPKNAKMLAIPWGPEALRHIRGGGTTRTFPKKLVFVKTKFGGWLVEFQKKRSIQHFLLTTHARIPAHPFLRPTLTEMMPRIKEIFST